MRTRAQGSSSPTPNSPPPATRRRKRASALPTDAAANPEQLLDDAQDTLADTIVVAPAAVTPTKPSKRVRFSDPGPLVAQNDSTSTGLTPHIRRFSITSPSTAARRLTRQRPARRASMPAAYVQPSYPLPAVQEFQFTSLKQLLGDRTRRRLKRNHLSEEINDFEAHQKREERMRNELAELTELRVQAKGREDAVKELTLELELQRQLGIEVNQEEEDRVRALKEEIEILKKAVADPAAPIDHSEAFADETLLSAEDQSQVSDQREVLQDITPAQQSSDAQAALEVVANELRSLGFAGAHPEEIIASIHAAFRQTRLDLEYLLPGETPGGFSNSALLPQAIAHLRSLLDKANSTSTALKRQQQSESALRGQFNDALRRLERLDAAKRQLDLDYHDLRKRAGVKDVRVRDLEAECATHVASTQKLQAALQSYRDEVANLEALLTLVEKDKAAVEESLNEQLREKQAVIRTLQDEVQLRAEDAEAAMDKADDLQRTLARTERELEETKTLLARRAEDAGRVLADMVGCFDRAGEEAEGLAETFAKGIDENGEKVLQIQWHARGRARDSGVGLSSDGMEEL